MEKSKSKVVFITIIVLLILVIAGLVCYIVLDKNNENKGETEKQEQTIQNTPTPEAIQTPEETEQERELTTAELAEIEEYLNNWDNGQMSLFLVSEFKKPEDALLSYKILYGYNNDKDLSKMVTLVDEDEEVISTGWTEEEIESIREFTGIAKIKAEDLNQYLNQYLNVSTDDVNLEFMEYSREYDAYYFADPTDAFVNKIDIISGNINEEGLYVIKYINEDEWFGDYEWTATMKKVEAKYQFISNINEVSEKINEIKETEGLKSEKHYLDEFEYECIFYYKNNELYYAETIDEGDKSYTFYFENSKCFAYVEDYKNGIIYGNYDMYLTERIYETFTEEVKGE